MSLTRNGTYVSRNTQMSKQGLREEGGAAQALSISFAGCLGEGDGSGV